MRYLKKFQKYTEGAAAEPETKPQTKPETEPGVDPDTRPDPGPRPSPIRRDRPVETPDPMGRSDSDKDIQSKDKMKRAKAEEVAERFVSLAKDRGIDLKKYKR